MIKELEKLQPPESCRSRIFSAGKLYPDTSGSAMGLYTDDNLDLNNARKVLDDDHFGLDEVKERILEHLAVLKLKGDLKSPILCLYGPPGVGKTSLGRSVAKALDRKYVRMSLGGLA